MTREAFERQLTELEAATTTLGMQALSAVTQAIQALMTQDLVLARKVVEEDASINRWERKVLDDSALLLMLQAPVASDLRRILGVSRVAGYHERIGDHARDISNSTIRMSSIPPLSPPTELELLAERVAHMLRESVQCYSAKDAEQARAVCALDDEVDRLYGQLFSDVLTRIRDDNASGPRATYVLFVARNLERIADYAANVAEAAIYVVTGKTEDLN